MGIRWEARGNGNKSRIWNWEWEGMGISLGCKGNDPITMGISSH